ncbi:MAG: hypothetical protein APF76_02050 [Desulfitibacter sp. BRH_c19]|nr:MAG: hypothetical protein APF76_02050 [Desulfitibacter sp. BRH_c19]
MNEIKDTIESTIKGAVKKNSYGIKEPLIGYASPNDHLFQELKRLHPHHLMPEDLLGDVKSIVAFYLPFDLEIARSNRGGNKVSEKWASAYINANSLINKICTLLTDRLKELDVKATYQKATHNFDEETLKAAWSHRSIAYIAGLGTFGVNKMLITPVGCAGRFGSIAINYLIEPTVRPDKEYCLFYQGRGCLKCVKACPVGALTENSIDKYLCYDRLLKVAEDYSSMGLADVCGKCIGPCANY